MKTYIVLIAAFCFSVTMLNNARANLNICVQQTLHAGNFRDACTPFCDQHRLVPYGWSADPSVGSCLQGEHVCQCGNQQPNDIFRKFGRQDNKGFTMLTAHSLVTIISPCNELLFTI